MSIYYNKNLVFCLVCLIFKLFIVYLLIFKNFFKRGGMVLVYFIVREFDRRWSDLIRVEGEF